MVAVLVRIPLAVLVVASAALLGQAQTAGDYTSGHAGGPSTYGGYSGGSSGGSYGSSNSGYRSSGSSSSSARGSSSSSSGSYRGGSSGGQTRFGGGRGSVSSGGRASYGSTRQSRQSTPSRRSASSGTQSRGQSRSSGSSYQHPTQSSRSYRSGYSSRGSWRYGAEYGGVAYPSTNGGRRGASRGGGRGASSGGQVRGRNGRGNSGMPGDRFSAGGGSMRGGVRPEPWRKVTVQGRVAMAVADIPPEGVLVKCDCGGGLTPLGYTDMRGNFSFRLNTPRSNVLTRSAVGTSRGFIGTNWRSPSADSGLGCELFFDAPGFGTNRIRVAGPFYSGANDLGVISLRSLNGVTGNVVSATTWMASKEARAAYAKGLKALRRKNPQVEQSILKLQKAVELAPQFAAAWAALGEARMLLLADFEGARLAYKNALDADRQYLQPYEPLMELAERRGDWATLVELGDAYLKLSPNATRALYLTALASLKRRNNDRAEELVLLMRDRGEIERWPRGYLILASIYEQRVEFTKAAEMYREFLRLQSHSVTAQQVSWRLYEWEKLMVIEPRESSDT